MYFLYCIFMAFMISIMYEYSGLNGIKPLNVLMSFILLFIITLVISNNKKRFRLRVGILASIIALLSIFNCIKVRFQLSEISFFDLKLAKAAGDIAGLFLDKLPYLQMAIIILLLLFSLIFGNLLPTLYENFLYSKNYSSRAKIEDILENIDKFFSFLPIKLTFLLVFISFFTFTSIIANLFPISSFGGLLLSGKSMAENYAQKFENKEKIKQKLLKRVSKDKLAQVDTNDKLLAGYPFDAQTNMDVVIIQSESFFDLPKYQDKLEKNGIVIHDDNVTTNFRNYQNMGISGNLYVPTVGGGTVNTEYEVLTGYGAKYFARGSIIFTSVLNKKTDSLAKYMKDNMPNVSTIGIHNHNADYWDRDRVYPLLSIDKFVDMTQFSPEQQKHLAGAWMSDKTIFDMSYAQLENEPEKNKFLLSVTVQNHGPFLGTLGQPIQTDNLSLHDGWEMNNYISNLKYSDEQLKSFMDYITNRKKPTMVIFYGDHKPDANYDIFKNSNFYKGSFNRNIFNTDYFIYFNNAVTNPKLTALKGIRQDMTAPALNRYIQMLLGDNTPLSMYIYNYIKNLDNYFNQNVISGAQNSNYRTISLNFINQYVVEPSLD